MKPQFVLPGLLFHGAEFFRVEATLFERAEADSWRGRLDPFGQARVGDRLRFGETSESTACLLGSLNAEITALSGADALLSFEFAGVALEEALERLSTPAENGK